LKHAKGKPYSVAKKNGGFTLFENGVQMARVGIQGDKTYSNRQHRLGFYCMS